MEKNYKSSCFKTALNCKMFLIFILMLKYKNNFFKKSSVFIKKHKRKTITILKSPYRHKLARHQIMLNRYKINFSSNLKIRKSIYVKNIKNIKIILKGIINFFNFFETNLIFVSSSSFSIPFKFKNNFLLSKFTNFKNK